MLIRRYIYLFYALLSLFSGTGLAQSVAMQPKKPDYYCFVVDKSGSIENRKWTELIKGAVTQFAGRLDDGTELEVVLFNNSVPSWGRDRGDWWGGRLDRPALARFTEWFYQNYKPNNQTRLYDTVAEAIERVKPRAMDYRSVMILVISDGEDSVHRPNERGSTVHKDWSGIEKLAGELQQLNTNAYVVVDALGYSPNAPRPSPPIMLKEFSDPTKYKLQPPPPKADFESHPSVVQTGEKVKFWLLSETYVKSTLWSFGDGTASTNIKPDHAYTTEGVKNVQVVVTGEGGKSVTNVLQGAVTVKKFVPLEARFKATPAQARVGDTVILSDESLGAPEAWSWTITGREVVMERNPAVIFTKAGDLNVTLEVRKDDVKSTTNKIIHVLPPIPLKAAFLPVKEARAGETVRLVDTSEGGPEKWQWEVKGHKPLSGRYPEITLGAPGETSISLTVTHRDGRKDTTTQTINILPPPPEPKFQVLPKRLVTGKDIVFKADNPSGGEIHEWWLDGKLLQGITSAEGRLPSVTAGSHTMRHVAKNTFDAEEFEHNFLVEEALAAVFSVQTPEKDRRSGASISFIDSSRGTIEKRQWAFGDGNTSTEQNPVHRYDSSEKKSYTVVLTISGPDGTCGATNTIIIVPQPPDADFTLSEKRLIVGKSFTLKAVKSKASDDHLWLVGEQKIGGGRGVSDILWKPATAGAHTLRHVVSGAGGGQEAEKTVIVSPALAAAFEVLTPPEQRRSGVFIGFVDKSAGEIEERYWEFGDGRASTELNPIHSYETAISTNYVVKLTVKGPDGTKTFTQNIVVSAGLVARFDIDRKRGQLPLRGRPFVVKMINQTEPAVGDYSFFWDFGDGTTSNERAPEHYYQAVSNYIVRLTVTDNNANGLVRNAPDVVVSVQPNTQVRNWIVWQSAFVGGAFLAALIWAIMFRQPWPAKTYVLGRAQLNRPSLTIGAALLATKARHDISLPFREHFIQNFARIERTEYTKGWVLFAEPAAENNLAVNGAPVNPASDSGVVLKDGDDIFFGEWNYRYELLTDGIALLRRNSPAPIAARLLGAGALVFGALIPSFVFLYQLFN